MLGLSVHLEALEQVLRVDSAARRIGGHADRPQQRRAGAQPRCRRSTSAGPPSRPAVQRESADVPASAVVTGIDGVERVYGNAVVERGPWLVSVGIPTVGGAGRGPSPIYRRNFVDRARLDACWCSCSPDLFGAPVAAVRSTISMPTARARQPRRSVAARRRSRCRPRDGAPAEDRQRHDHQPARRARRARRQVDEERRMREELESLQRQVIRQERLAAVGVLVSGVAHELNNPLQAILGFAELLQMHEDLPEQARADLTLIQKESARACAIIRNLSRFGRADVGALARAAARRHRVGAGAAPAPARGAEHPSRDRRTGRTALVMAIFTELQQVLLNFVDQRRAGDRAVRARPGAQSRFAPATRRLGVARGRRHRPRRAARGRGQAVPAVLHHQAGRPRHRLGLSVSYGIIESHGGRIGYVAAPAGGAMFYFELPIVRTSSARNCPVTALACNCQPSTIA